MPKTRTVAYVRVSTEKQADRGQSLEAQQAKIKAQTFKITITIEV